MTFGPFDRVRSWWRGLPSETRFSSIIIGGCGVTALGLSVMFLRSNISLPFLVPIATLTAARQALVPASDAAREAEAAKSKDTDRDGLSDYAELTIYKSSPYLADTDSDGIPDAIEIGQGTDPNCPNGQNCGGVANANLEPSKAATSSNRNLLGGAAVKTIPEQGVASTAAETFIREAPEPSTISAAQARTLLLQSGLIAPDGLNGLTDSGVLQVYGATYVQVLKIRESLKNPAL